MGAAGQSNYAAANTVLDALAHRRRARGLAATAIAWGYWSERSGMTAHLEDADLARLQRLGIQGMSSAEGLALMDAALARGEPLVVASKIQRAALAAQPTVPPMLGGLVPRRARRVAAAAGGATSLGERLSRLPEAERDQVLVDLVVAEAASVLGVKPQMIDTQCSVTELGLDSLMGVELRNRLQAALGVRLSAGLFWKYPTVAAIAEQLLSMWLVSRVAIGGGSPAPHDGELEDRMSL
jgi:acyl carrier protein